MQEDHERQTCEMLYSIGGIRVGDVIFFAVDGENEYVYYYKGKLHYPDSDLSRNYALDIKRKMKEKGWQEW
jgi:hypothetical protein